MLLNSPQTFLQSYISKPIDLLMLNFSETISDKDHFSTYSSFINLMPSPLLELQRHDSWVTTTSQRYPYDKPIMGCFFNGCFYISRYLYCIQKRAHWIFKFCPAAKGVTLSLETNASKLPALRHNMPKWLKETTGKSKNTFRVNAHQRRQYRSTLSLNRQHTWYLPCQGRFRRNDISVIHTATGMTRKRCRILWPIDDND